MLFWRGFEWVGLSIAFCQPGDPGSDPSSNSGILGLSIGECSTSLRRTQSGGYQSLQLCLWLLTPGDSCPMEEHQFALGGNSSKGQQLPHKTLLFRGLETLGMLRAPMGKINDFFSHTVYSVIASRPERGLKRPLFLGTMAPLLLATHHQSNSNGFDTFGS